MIAGLVLAAGASARMGRPKALLPVGSGGEVAVEVVLSPKFHERDAIVPSLSVEASVKFAVSPLVVNV